MLGTLSSDLPLGGRGPTVAVEQVTHRYGDTVALDGVSAAFPRGITVLLGRNGAGKSTLSRLLAGAEAPCQGTVVTDGKKLDGEAAVRWYRRRCGWLPQAFGAPPAMTVRQFLEYAAWLKEVPSSVVDRRVEEALEAADLVASRHRRLGNLSGGMVRRAGIAQAVVHDPDVLVLDEPTAGLDPEQRASFHRLLRRLASDRTVLVSTHLLEDVLVLADRLVVLEQGRVVFSGSVDGLGACGDGSGDRTEQVRAGFLTVIKTAGRL